MIKKNSYQKADIANNISKKIGLSVLLSKKIIDQLLQILNFLEVGLVYIKIQMIQIMLSLVVVGSGLKLQLLRTVKVLKD